MKNTETKKVSRRTHREECTSEKHSYSESNRENPVILIDHHAWAALILQVNKEERIKGDVVVRLSSHPLHHQS
jgi:hypothetical protein